jgi:hypothetical protein
MDRSALRRPTGPVELPLSDSGAVALKQYFAARAHRFQDDNGKGWSFCQGRAAEFCCLNVYTNCWISFRSRSVSSAVFFDSCS